MNTSLLKSSLLAVCISIFCTIFATNTLAQDLPIEQQKFIYFPHPATQKWTTSVGITATTLPYDITEELHYRVPAGDVHVMRKVSDKFSLDGRASLQGLQNLLTVGGRWNTKLNNRFSMGVGDEIGYWFGYLHFAGFKSRASGWQNYPNVSFGYRFNNQVLLTVRADAVLNFNINTYADKQRVVTDYRLLSGSSYTVAVEQPFFGKKNLILGFRAYYTDFFWQTWASFESFDRNIFFPQLIIGLVL
jgi:hypothetical protein